MTETEFHNHVEKFFSYIDDELYKLEVDFDYLVAEGVFTFDFDNGTKIIISRQTPVSEIWLATVSGAFHFSFDETSNQWLENSSKKEFLSVLSQHCTSQAEEDVKFEPMVNS